jgi:cathepsin F
VKHSRKYLGEEKQKRFEIFQQNLVKIEKLNQNSRHAKFGVTKFADMTTEEFRSKRLMKQAPAEDLAQSCLAKGVTSKLDYSKADIAALPDALDWRSTGGKSGSGIVTQVKDQGDCGSCWAFSTIAAIESSWALLNNTLTEFSEQLIVDCSHGCSDEPPYGTVCNQGCNGGWQWNAFYDVVKWGGVETEADYPYKGYDQTCKKGTNLVAKLKNYTCLSGPDPVDEEQLRAYVAANGPVSIALDAGLLQFYYGGIIDPFFPTYECDPMVLDHALLLVGWGQERNMFFVMTPYWIVKNSWGTDWGETGYFLIARNGNVCGLANAVSAPLMS